MTNPPNPAEGQFFTLQSVPPPAPKANTHWGLPLALGLLAIPLLMLGFGFAQQQKATEAPPTQSSTPAAPSLEPSPSPVATPQASSTERPAPSPLPEAAPLIDAANLPVATIRATNVAVNFRQAPSLRSQVLGVLMPGDLVQLIAERPVIQDGVTWTAVRFREQAGWVASNFIGGQTHGGL